jgi:hypothetical protein
MIIPIIILKKYKIVITNGQAASSSANLNLFDNAGKFETGKEVVQIESAD